MPDLSKEKSTEKLKAHLTSRSLSSRGCKFLYDSKSRIAHIKPTLYATPMACNSIQGKTKATWNFYLEELSNINRAGRSWLKVNSEVVR